MTNGLTNKLIENNSFSIDPYVPTAVYISKDNTIYVSGTSIQSNDVAENSQMWKWLGTQNVPTSHHSQYKWKYNTKSKPIFTCPKSITRTKNGNIFVVDECGGNGKVIILDDKEKEVNIYTGSKLTHDNKFTPENITATASDIVIITEPNEHSIFWSILDNNTLQHWSH